MCKVLITGSISSLRFVGPFQRDEDIKLWCLHAGIDPDDDCEFRDLEAVAGYEGDFIAMLGNPFNGFTLEGGFEDYEAAATHAERDGGDWFVLKLEQPELPSDEHIRIRKTLAQLLVNDCMDVHQNTEVLEDSIRQGLTGINESSDFDLIQWFRDAGIKEARGGHGLDLALETLAVGNPLRVLANAHSDDHNVEIEFDAAAWFEQATHREIRALAEEGWGICPEADRVAEFFDGKPGYEDTASRLFNYLSCKPKQLNGDPCGYEVDIDDESAMAWLAVYRPDLHRKLAV